MNNDTAIEATIQAKGLTAPRITKDEIDALCARITYVEQAQPGNTTSTFVHAYLDGKFFLATGHSACVSPENFNAQIGLDIARSKAAAAARDKLWELEGYALFRRLPSMPQSDPDDFPLGQACSTVDGTCEACQ